MIFRRILGLLMLLTALAILAFTIAGGVYVGGALARLGDSLQANLTLVSDSLATARETLVLSRDTFGDVNGGLGTAIDATASASRTVAESQPLIENITTVVTQEVPEAVEGIQGALPNMIQVAGVIDQTLRTLSSVGIDRTIPLPFGGSIPLKFDLGIDYSPVSSFDSSLRGFQTSLNGLPESLRGLESDLQTTSANLATLSTDLQATSDNLATINDRVGAVVPIIDQYLTLIDDLNTTVSRVSADIDRQLETLRLGAMVGLLFLALSQLAPLYLGWELLSGRRGQASTALAPASAVVINPETPAKVTVALDSPDTVELPDEAWTPAAPPEDRERT